MHIDYRTMEEDGAYYRLGTRKNSDGGGDSGGDGGSDGGGGGGC